MRTTKWYYKKIRNAKTLDELQILLLMACIQTTQGKMRRRTLMKILIKIKEKNSTWTEKNTTESSENNTRD